MTSPAKQPFSHLRSPAWISALLTWFAAAQRPMPWRQTRDPYAIWLSETMLQQTQVETVKPFYHKFLQRFPTVEELAAADLQDVLGLWAGLGYYRRARHLHAAARMMVEKFGGKVPDNVAQLLELPGVGRYTAGAVASIAFSRRAAVVDGNVQRVLCRLGNVSWDLASAQTQQRLWFIAEALVPQSAPGDYNQALMELGATICLPGRARCERCPLAAACAARTAGTVAELPRKSPKKVPEERELIVFVVSDDRGRVLLGQRPAGGLWEHLWEFPAVPAGDERSEQAGGVRRAGCGRGAKGAGGETRREVNPEARMADVLKRHFGLRMELEAVAGVVRHQLSHRRLNYRIFRGRAAGRGAPRLGPCDAGHYQAWAWRAPEELGTLPVARVTRKIAAAAGLAEPTD